MEYYTYQLRSSKNQQIFYIGKGSGARMFKHIQIAQSNSKNRLKNPKLYNKISKILREGFYVIAEIIFKSTDENLCLKKEIETIKELGLKNLCNLTEGGEGTSGYKLSEETKKRMSIAAKGKSKPWLKGKSKGKSNFIRNKKISESLKGHKGYWKDKKLSEETKKKMSEIKIGRKTGPISIKRRLAIIEGIKNKKSKNVDTESGLLSS